jgi:hypothetical protein
MYVSVPDTILKHAFHMLETPDENREKLHAMELFKDMHLDSYKLKCIFMVFRKY